MEDQCSSSIQVFDWFDGELITIRCELHADHIGPHSDEDGAGWTAPDDIYIELSDEDSQAYRLSE